MRQYYLHIDYAQTNHAGSKAVADCEAIMERLGFKRISLYSSKLKNKWLGRAVKAKQFLDLYRIPRKSMLVVEHPIYLWQDYMSHLERLKKKKDISLVFIIHDLEMLRKMLPDSDFYEERDKKMCQLADVIIAHNAVMKDYLVETCHVSSEKIVILGIFDYLVSKENRSNNSEGSEVQIAVAGNLSPIKSGYIYELSKIKEKSFSLNLYGVNLEKDMLGTSCNYKGSFAADELPQIMEGAYGLVWDGASLQKCEGNTGNYLRYNNPHKVSLYIASEMPVVIWKEAALAAFVEQHRIGLLVDSLEELNSAISGTTEEVYKEFKSNLKNIADDVRKGKYLECALKEAQKRIEFHKSDRV